MLRADVCLTCGAVFTAPHRHPMIEEAWCPECHVIVREMCLLAWPAHLYWLTPALRADDV